MFKKNDKIAIISNWNGKGAFRIRRGKVHSAGKKLMRIEFENGEMLQDAIYMDYFNKNIRFQVVADASNSELEAIALENAAKFVADEKARFERNKLNVEAGEGYIRAQERNLAALEAPSAFFE